MPGRRIQIDVGGEIIDMDWDKPTPPTKRDFQAWVQQRRNVVPSATPAPQVQAPAQPKDTGFLGAIGEGLSGLGHFAGNVVKASNFNPYTESRNRAQTEIRKGFTDPFMQGGKEAHEYEQKGENLKSIGRALATIPEAGLGIPVTAMARDVGEGRYGHAAGSGLFAGALAAMGSKIGRGKGRVVPEVPSPIKPPIREPMQMPLVEGFEQQGLPFRSPQETPGVIHGPEIGPYGVQDPTIPLPTGQPNLFGAQPVLQPAISQQKLGFEAKPTHAWTPGPAVGTMPERGPIAAAAKSPAPELQAAAAETSRWEMLRNKATTTKAEVKGSNLGRVGAEIGKGSTAVIRDSGKTGPALSQLLSRTRLLGEYLGGQWKVRAQEATKGLSPEQIESYVQSRDTGKVPSDPAVQAALQKRAALDTEVVKATKESGAGLRTSTGKKVEFRERENYWPHIYPKTALKNPAAILEKLIGEGWSPEDAQHALDNSGRFGERLISAQHERQGNAPGYRLDLDADYLHLNDMGKRVAEARELGPMDIASPDSPVSQLIKGTAEPGRIAEIVSQHLGRDAPTSSSAAWGAVNQATRQVMTAAHLSHFALSNMSQLATVPLRSNLKAYTGALKKTFGSWGKAKLEAEGTGVLQTIHQDLLREVGGEGWVSKLYGLKQSETLNRTVSALAGKGTAQELFTQLKKDPTNKRALGRLQNLLLEDPAKILKQDALTPEQLGIAGGRMAEITQGRAQAIDLPKAWADHPGAEIPLIFKKYAFQQGKIIKDAIMENPARNIPLAIALYTAMGEGVGDVKAGVRGTLSGEGAGEAIAARGENLNRVIANMSQAWAFGMLADVLESSTSKPSGLAEYLAGPVISDIGKGAANIKSALEGNVKPIVKQGLGAVPIVGQGLAGRVGGGKGGGSGRLPRLPRPPALPTLPRP